MEHIFMSGSRDGWNQHFYKIKSQVLQLNGACHFERRGFFIPKLSFLLILLYFSWTGGIIIVKVKPGNLYEVAGWEITVEINRYDSYDVHVLGPLNT